MTDKKPPATGSLVGFCKPPVHSRFRKGQSGNPGGRPRGMTLGRAAALTLKEAYRSLRVKEGDKEIAMPAIQVVLRNQMALAAQGDPAAQRAVLQTVYAIERELALLEAAKSKGVVDIENISDTEAVRRIAYLFYKHSKAREAAGAPSYWVDGKINLEALELSVAEKKRDSEDSG